jgi:hypothetical protein
MNEHFRYVLPTLGGLIVWLGRAVFYAIPPRRAVQLVKD